MPPVVHHYEAFSREPGKGNPAGVVVETRHLSEEDMQSIAARVGFNETVFVQVSEAADLRLRFFTPGHEIDLCGHATMASLVALYERDLVFERHGLPEGERALQLRVETRAGILPVRLERHAGGMQITMRQAPARFQPFSGDLGRLARALGIDEADVDPALPIEYGSTGTWTLLVPVRGLDAMSRMRPLNREFPEVLLDMPRASVHPFCFETLDPAAQMHARHFSSPYSGTVEDAVTGTASGVMAAYVSRHRPEFAATHHRQFLIEQGQEIGRDGRVLARVVGEGEPLDVEITGTGVYVGPLQLD